MVQSTIGSQKKRYSSVCFNSDWAGGHATRKSMGGIIIFVGRAAVSWSARQQEVVALLSTDAKFFSMCTSVREVVWMLQLLDGFGLNSRRSFPMIVLVDNQGNLDLAKVSRLTAERKILQGGSITLEKQQKLELWHQNTAQLRKWWRTW